MCSILRENVSLKHLLCVVGNVFFWKTVKRANAILKLVEDLKKYVCQENFFAKVCKVLIILLKVR